MKIININDDFPKVNIGDSLDINDPNVGKHKDCKVLKVWYPKHGDKWSEDEERKHLGYLHSKPNEQFPQIMIKIGIHFATMYGTDAKYIDIIHPLGIRAPKKRV
jgi:hypothetical protein